MNSPRVLMVSPVPSHPRDQGNAARIYTLGRWLQAQGAVVHFLYYALEGTTPQSLAAMQATWDAVFVVRPRAFSLAPRETGYHGLDDWYDAAVTEEAARLQARYGYAAVIANYVWGSGVLAAFGDETVKFLDTHDVFGGRDARFIAAGLAPEWFWTTPEEEARGLARADIVLAIQDAEAAQFRALGHGDVRVLGHLPPWRRRLAREGRPVRIGYLASRNPINADSFRVLREALPYEGIKGARLMVAGALCDRLDAAAPFTVLGRVATPGAFYDQVDVVVNPMRFGTGLKIKSVEALFEDMPLVATREAMVGLPAGHDLHRLDDARAVARVLPEVARRAALRRELGVAGREVAAAYAAAVLAARVGVWREIAGK